MTNFQKFAKHLTACARLTWPEFCVKANLSEAAALDLLTSHGGRKYLFERLEEIRKDTLTVGDIVEYLVAGGHRVSVDDLGLLITDSSDRTRWYDMESHSYDLMQQTLQQVHDDFLGGES